MPARLASAPWVNPAAIRNCRTRLLDNLGRAVSYKRLLAAIERNSDNTSNRHLLRSLEDHERLLRGFVAQEDQSR